MTSAGIVWLAWRLYLERATVGSVAHAGVQ
jgi:hypothetical protein